MLDNDNEQLVPVTVHVNDFSISMEEYASARAQETVEHYTGVKAITLAFYTGTGTEQYKTTQLRTDATTYTTFGDFSLELPMGSYTMVVLGYTLYDDDALVLTSPNQAAFTTGDVRETFAGVEEVNITSTNAVELSATLNRIMTKLMVLSTDVKTANASKVRMTFSAGGKAFSPTTGLATINTGSTSTVNIGTAVGATSSSVGYVFLAEDEQTMNVTIDVLDAQGTSISHKVVSDVPFKRNRTTKLSGTLYTTSASTNFLLDTDWLPDYNQNF
ncbi:MAG: hypothetical protein IKZ62_06720 [Prevotella sp.]|nr:hypothetical protein [Prevotella sp.]